MWLDLPLDFAKQHGGVPSCVLVPFIWHLLIKNSFTSKEKTAKRAIFCLRQIWRHIRTHHLTHDLLANERLTVHFGSEKWDFTLLRKTKFYRIEKFMDNLTIMWGYFFSTSYFQLLCLKPEKVLYSMTLAKKIMDCKTASR